LRVEPVGAPTWWHVGYTHQLYRRLHGTKGGPGTKISRCYKLTMHRRIGMYIKQCDAYKWRTSQFIVSNGKKVLTKIKHFPRYIMPS
jgi:hypothetical protein